MKKELATIILTSALLAVTGCSSPEPDAAIQEVLDRYLTFWNTGDLSGHETVIHPDFELRMTPTFEVEAAGISGFQESIDRWRTAYPDFTVTVTEVAFGEETATIRWTITATNTGEGWHPPTGKRVEVPGMSLFHFQDGLIRDEWISGNNGLWLSQLGFELVSPFDREDS